ncbi:hypothetical protein [Candidatus Phytoplasma palmae]|uniref:hypothetical protein n=1 Tax=Candidatus Phytoplasma palmae TaxID=85624 RepID=UPI003990BC4F
MNFLLKFFKKKNKIELFPFIFDSVKGKSFREENYLIKNKKKKIEFFSLEKSKYYSHFIGMKQYTVWSIKGNIYRVFVEKNYYCEFIKLYCKEINILYMKFLYEILKKRLEIILKNFVFIFLFFLLSVVFFVFSYIIIDDKYNSLIFSIFLFLFFIFCCFYIIIKGNKVFLNYKKKLWDELIFKVKKILGPNVFEDIVKRQNEYEPLVEEDIKEKKVIN